MKIRAVAVDSFLLSIAALALPATLSAEALLSVSPTSLNAQANQGANAASQSVQITNSGNGLLKWSIGAPSANWLRVSPTSGTDAATVAVTFATSTLAAGDYQGTFNVTSSSGTPVTVRVGLRMVASGTTTTSTSSAEWTFCAAEGGFCAFTGTREVRYGANGSYYYKTLSGGTACTNSVFGDPISGVTKQCHLKATTTTTSTSTDFTFCAAEGGFCAFTGTREVRYGANGSYYYKTLTGGTACTNSVFGDPIPGVAKQCHTKATTTTTTSTDWTFCANENGVCAFSGTREVRYGANSSYYFKTLTGGTTCTNSVFGDPAPGVAKHCDTRPTTTTTTTAPPPPSSTYGPRSSIACPAGAVSIWPGVSIQTMVDTNPGNTTFCIRAGVHYLRNSIRPKTGDTFVGEYGAILDGTGWSSTDSTAAAFRAQNEDIDYVTIRNLVIRKMPQRGINAFYYMSDHWTIEYNEITSNFTGVLLPPYSTLRNNYIHHNTSGGYLGTYASYSTLEANEISYNGREQKIGESTNVTFRNNFVHHNTGDGIWYDSNNRGGLVEGNRVEDNAYNGIFYEIGTDLIVRNNTVRRSGNAAMFISTSKNSQIYGNTLEHNFRGILYFVNCSSVGGGSIGFDLSNNSSYNNTIVVGTQSGALANGFSWTLCTSTQVAPYLNGSKGLSFSRNTYDVPSPSTGQYWLWNGVKYWNQWLSLAQDAGSSVY